jgi:phenylpropionate dioxygenase-like ring-hydroxylating dioxygenase large terminal subunit
LKASSANKLNPWTSGLSTGSNVRRYELKCNWKVFVDNYLDGGYHVPHLHKGLDSVLDYSNYTIENGERFCLQSSPMVATSEGEIGAVRSGQRALYYWLYPNFMINYYEGTLDTNLVRPLAIDRTEVVSIFTSETFPPQPASAIWRVSRSGTASSRKIWIFASRFRED